MRADGTVTNKGRFHPPRLEGDYINLPGLFKFRPISTQLNMTSLSILDKVFGGVNNEGELWPGPHDIGVPGLYLGRHDGIRPRNCRMTTMIRAEMHNIHIIQSVG